MKWIQAYDEPGLSDQEIKDYIRQSHTIVSRGLSKKKRIALDLEEPAAATPRRRGR
jgi:predicted DNA-binding protein (MmcQ/YjbR family)